MTMTPPPFDPELAAALEAIKDLVPRGLTMDDIPAMRQGPGIALMAQLDLTVDGFEVEDRLVPGPEGSRRSRCSSAARPRPRHRVRCR
ncbi:hypothetical protein IQ64_21885 [Streptomyces stelliscabiei]|uniref:Uncharacterized protein n=1 Tax=Streptomyces stelliscabiei TaxID=146820 RepID=A0A8I0TVN4_9ACTN|nr:hypothetical protein IQ64_21885 [Streptomyces stelliscabiei]MBE1601954.1 hypothetical protein [Streptomyces stelliscabiei]